MKKPCFSLLPKQYWSLIPSAFGDREWLKHCGYEERIKITKQNRLHRLKGSSEEEAQIRRWQRERQEGKEVDPLIQVLESVVSLPLSPEAQPPHKWVSRYLHSSSSNPPAPTYSVDPYLIRPAPRSSAVHRKSLHPLWNSPPSSSVPWAAPSSN